MNISIHSKNINVTSGIENRINKAFAKVEKLVPDYADLRIVIDVISRREVHKVEATLTVHNDIIRAECETEDLYDSINGACDTLVRRIKKYNAKNRAYSADTIRMAEVIEDEAESAPTIKRVKPIALKTQSKAAAIEQMELLGHSFHLFVDEETGAPAAAYRRTDGDYGVLVSAL